ncbi:hypothetical protein BKG61_18785 [Mycobacterium syngnathidarum]|uniref:Uncharacterized protein n=1 Tax=Mycobacterium syngnathidarum TaxID=1908205 RepID=A0A1S1JVS3_9MYCO|nr:hypothetical protein BKG61_18785 [Mycobacterium syngnathidarum]
MNDRIPRAHRIEGSGRVRQVEHVRGLKPQLRAAFPGQGHHRRGPVDACGAKSARGKFGCRVTGTAPHIEHRLAAVVGDQLGEGPQHCAIQRAVIELAGKGSGVLGRDQVVLLACPASHGAHSRQP